MTAAYELVCRELKRIARNDPLMERVAIKVIELAQNGERDPAKIKGRALLELLGGGPRQLAADLTDSLFLTAVSRISYKLRVVKIKKRPNARKCRACGGKLITLLHLEKKSGGNETTYFSCTICAQIEIKES